MGFLFAFFGFILFFVFFFSNSCDRKLLVHNRIFVGLVEKALGVLLCQINLLNYLFGKN